MRSSYELCSMIVALVTASRGGSGEPANDLRSPNFTIISRRLLAANYRYRYPFSPHSNQTHIMYIRPFIPKNLDISQHQFLIKKRPKFNTTSSMSSQITPTNRANSSTATNTSGLEPATHPARSSESSTTDFKDRRVTRGRSPGLSEARETKNNTFHHDLDADGTEPMHKGFLDQPFTRFDAVVLTFSRTLLFIIVAAVNVWMADQQDQQFLEDFGLFWRLFLGLPHPRPRSRFITWQMLKDIFW
ncbi:hypothetical protein V8E51_011504 [Hyaloscypha variabilis]